MSLHFIKTKPDPDLTQTQAQQPLRLRQRLLTDASGYSSLSCYRLYLSMEATNQQLAGRL